MAENELYYTTAEAARSLGVSIKTVQLWVDNGVLAAWRTAGGHRRILVDSVERFSASSKIIAGTSGKMKPD